MESRCGPQDQESPVRSPVSLSPILTPEPQARQAGAGTHIFLWGFGHTTQQLDRGSSPVTAVITTSTCLCARGVGPAGEDRAGGVLCDQGLAKVWGLLIHNTLSSSMARPAGRSSTLAPPTPTVPGEFWFSPPL